MKLRTQRVHLMGTSNRTQDILPVSTHSVLENSYFKSKSSYYKTAQSLPPAPAHPESKTDKPFKGTHLEQ